MQESVVKYFLFFLVDPGIKFKADPSAEQVALADANGAATIPTASGVVILLESGNGKDDVQEQGKRSGKKRRNEEPEVQVINEPTVRFLEYLKRPPPLIELRRHVMISQVNYYTASTRFFEPATSLLPHIKRMIADMPWGKSRCEDNKSKPDTEHDYAFPSTSGNGHESDVDI